MSQVARNRRYRERQRKRLTYAEVELPHSLTASLINMGFLSEPDSFNPKKIGEAFMRYIAEQRRKLT
jgi:hypothetical protein